MDRAEFIYVGIRKSDGSIRATCCDDAGEEADTAEKVADWIKRGLTVERLTDAEYQNRMRAALASTDGRER
jgi:hypothetical protein